MTKTQSQPEAPQDISLVESVRKAYGDELAGTFAVGILFKNEWGPPNTDLDVKYDSEQKKVAMRFFHHHYIFGFGNNIAETIKNLKNNSLESQKYSRYLEFLAARGYNGRGTDGNDFHLQSLVASQSDLDRIVSDIKEMLDSEVPK